VLKLIFIQFKKQNNANIHLLLLFIIYFSNKLECCIFHKKREFGESDSEDSNSDSDDDEKEHDNDEHCEHCHNHDSHDSNSSNNNDAAQ